MAVGFGIVTVALLVTFAKYFSKRWFIWFMGAVIAAEVGMFMNAGSRKKIGENAEVAGASKSPSSANKGEIPAQNGQNKA